MGQGTQRTATTPLTFQERSRHVMLKRRRRGLRIAGSNTFSETATQLIAGMFRFVHKASTAVCRAPFHLASRSGWPASGARRWHRWDMVRDPMRRGSIHACCEHSRSESATHCAYDRLRLERAVAIAAALYCGLGFAPA